MRASRNCSHTNPFHQPAYFNSDAERQDYGNGKMIEYPYVPDEIRPIPVTFENLDLNEQPVCDSANRFIRKYQQEFSEDRFEFKIEKVMHSTNETNYNGILRDRLFFKIRERGYNLGFEGNTDVINGSEPENMAWANFLWFTAYVQSGKEKYLNFLEQRHTQIQRKWVSNGFINIETTPRYPHFPREFYCTTKPFGFVPAGEPNKNMNYALTFDLKDLLARYCTIVGSEYVCATRLGTEVYKQEIMQPLVFHPPVENLSDGDRQALFHSPLMGMLGSERSQNDDTLLYHPTRPGIVDPTVIYDASRAEFNGELLWKPYSTATDFSYIDIDGRKVERFTRWDHPAFAFLLPEAIKDGQDHDRQGFDLSRLKWNELKLEVPKCAHCTLVNHQTESCWARHQGLPSAANRLEAMITVENTASSGYEHAVARNSPNQAQIGRHRPPLSQRRSFPIIERAGTSREDGRRQSMMEEDYEETMEWRIAQARQRYE